MTTSLLYQEDYQKKEINLEKCLAEAENIKNQALKMQKQYDRVLYQKAKKLTEKNRDLCQREYRQKINAVYGITITALLYSIFVTLLTGINSVRFSRDFADALQYAFTILKIPFDIAVKMSKTVYKIKQMIQYVNINIIIAGLLTVFTFVATVAIGYGLIYQIARRSVTLQRDIAQDIGSMTVALLSLAPLVQFADRLTWLRVNLVIVWLLVNYIFLKIMAVVSQRSQRSKK